MDFIYKEEFHKLALLSNNMPMLHINENKKWLKKYNLHFKVHKNFACSNQRYTGTLLVLIKGTQELCLF